MALDLDLTELADGKFDLDSMPSGGNPLNYVRDFEWNDLCAVVDSVRDAALDLDDMITTLSATVETSSDAIVGLQGLTGSHGDRLTDLETSSDTSSDAIAGLQTLAADHGGRITALEEAPDGGDSLWSESDAITATMADYSNVLVDALPGADRDDPSGLIILGNSSLTDKDQFAIGNPYIAGIGYAAFGIYHRTWTGSAWSSWALIWSQELTGTVAPVHDGVRRPSFEAYLQNGDEKPWTRIDSSSQSIQFGSGGHVAAPGQATRSGTTLTCTTGTEHKLGALGVGKRLYKQTLGGAAQYGADGEWLTVASVVDADTFTVTVADSGITSNTLPISFSTESFEDVEFGRGGFGIAEMRVDGETIYQGSTQRHMFFLGGSLKCYVDVDGFHYTPTYWANSGGETQTGQDTFYVDGATTTVTDTTTAGGNGSRRRIWNARASGTVTVSVTSGTINGTTSYVIANGEGVDLDALGTNWRCAKLAP